MLQLDPNDRIDCENALAHPFLKAFHDPEDEPIGVPFDDKYENQEFSVQDWKSKLSFFCVNV